MANFLKSLFVKGIEIDPAGATNAQVLSYNGTKFVPAAAAAGGSSVTVSDTAPVSPTAGDVWYESDTGILFVRYDSYWVEVGGDAGPEGGSVTLTTKGDILTRSASALVRQGVGTNGYFLKADSTQTTGLVWATIPSVSILDDVGDVIITSATTSQVLQWNGTNWVNATLTTDPMNNSKFSAIVLMDIGV